jgi:hypothetical protein
MPVRTELTVRLPNSPGALAGVCRLLGQERIDIEAVSLESAGHLHLVVENHVRAAAVLRERYHQVAEREVIVVAVSPGPGALGAVLGLATDAGLNVDYAYGGAGSLSASATVVLGVTDAIRAAAAAGL